MNTLKYTKGWKYRVEKTIKIQLHNPFDIQKGYSCKYYSITKDGVLTAYEGCGWDGPTWFPDFKWMMVPSLIHDCLHWLIAKGTIGEWANDLIDAELAYWITRCNGHSPIWKVRARYVKLATMRVDEKYGHKKPIHEIKFK